MSGPADAHAPPSPHAHFPWVQAVFSAACVGMAAWLWVKHSYAWDVTPLDLAVEGEAARKSLWVARYVRVSGVLGRAWPTAGVTWMELEADTAGMKYRTVVEPFDREVVEPGPASVKGRVWVWERHSSRKLHIALRVDATASRLTGESVAGLVVGAMGVFVFALHLRRWLLEWQPRDPG